MELDVWARNVADGLAEISEQIKNQMNGKTVSRSVLIKPHDALGGTEKEAEELADPKNLEANARRNRNSEEINKKINDVVC